MSKPVIPMPLGQNITISKDGLLLYFQNLGSHLVDALPQWILGITIILLGWKISNRLVGVLERILSRRDAEPGLRTFLRSLTSALFKIFFIITGAGIMGLNTAGLVTLLGAAGLAIGLALQGALSNFAGGVLILLFKPFKVGDVIEAQTITGEVKEIQIFNTLLITAQHKTVILANGALSNGTIINHSRCGQLRTELIFFISLTEDLHQIQEWVNDFLNKNPLVLKHPEPQLYFGKIIDGQLQFHVRAFVNAHSVNEDESVLMGGLIALFQSKKLHFALPQRIVHSNKT